MNIAHLIPASLRQAIAKEQIECRLSALQGELKQVREQLQDFKEKLRDSRKTLKAVESERDDKSSKLLDKTFSCERLEKKCKELTRELEALSAKFVDVPISDIRAQWLCFHINRLNASDYGCGQYYEIWEHQRNEATRRFLAQYGDGLTSDEIAEVKAKCEYQSDYKVYSEQQVDENGKVVERNIYDMVNEEMT